MYEDIIILCRMWNIEGYKTYTAVITIGIICK